MQINSSISIASRLARKVPQPLRCLRLALLAGLLSLMLNSMLMAEPGISANQVLLGMANAQTGPASGIGAGVSAGAQAYFSRVNAAGGIHGRKISLILKDDGYEPARTAAVTHELIEQDGVFALLGYVGTPTSRAALPIALDAQVPYLFPFTGAEFLRTPVRESVFTVRASYYDETEAIVEHLTNDLGMRKIAILMQDDSFGETVKGGLAGALYGRDLHIQHAARIKRNSLDVMPAVQALKSAEPQAIVFVGTYMQLAAAVKQARAIGLNARFVTVSFIGTENFISAGGADAEGVYITQVVPSPYNRALPIIQQYLLDIAPADIGYGSLEGYVDAWVFSEALRKAGPEPTRKALVKALQTLTVDLGGFPVAFSPTNHQGSNAVFLTRVQDGRALPVQHME